MTELKISGEKVTDVDELEEGDKITAVAHGDITVEDTGTSYKIPDISVTDKDVVKVEGAEIQKISTTFGGLPQFTLDTPDHSLRTWLRESEHYTVYKINS